MALTKWIEFEEHSRESGRLVALESNKDVPFDIRRVYYLYDLAPLARRGFHAHRELKQVAICVHGSCRFHLDDGRTREVVELSSPDRGILIESMLWREMSDFSDGCVLLVLASEPYDEDDYIRDYEEFKRALDL